MRISFADDFMTGCFFFVAEDNSHPHSFTYSVYISDYPTCALKGCTVIEKCNTESESPLSSNSSEFLTTLACTSTIPKNWAGVGSGGKGMEKHGLLQTTSSSACLEFLPKEDVME